MNNSWFELVVERLNKNLNGLLSDTPKESPAEKSGPESDAEKPEPPTHELYVNFVAQGLSARLHKQLKAVTAEGIEETLGWQYGPRQDFEKLVCDAVKNTTKCSELTAQVIASYASRAEMVKPRAALLSKTDRCGSAAMLEQLMAYDCPAYFINLRVNHEFLDDVLAYMKARKIDRARFQAPMYKIDHDGTELMYICSGCFIEPAVMKAKEGRGEQTDVKTEAVFLRLDDRSYVLPEPGQYAMSEIELHPADNKLNKDHVLGFIGYFEENGNNRKGIKAAN